MRLRVPRSAPNVPQKRPMSVQERPKSAQELPKSAPRAPQERPKSAQLGPGELPKASQAALGDHVHACNRESKHSTFSSTFLEGFLKNHLTMLHYLKPSKSRSRRGESVIFTKSCYSAYSSSRAAKEHQNLLLGDSKIHARSPKIDLWSALDLKNSSLGRPWASKLAPRNALGL